MSKNPFRMIYNALGSYAKWVGENQREWDAYNRYGPNWEAVIREQNAAAAERMLSLQAKRREAELTEAADFARTGMRATDKTAPFSTTFEDGREVRRYDFSPDEPHTPSKTRAEILAEMGVAEEAEKGRFERLLKVREFGRRERESAADIEASDALRRYREGEIQAQPEKARGERLRQQRTVQEIAKGVEEQSALRRRRAVAEAMRAAGEFKSDAEAEAFIMRGFVPARDRGPTAADKSFERTVYRDRVLAYANEIAGPVVGEEGQEFAAYGKLEDVPPDIRLRAENAVSMQIAAEKKRERQSSARPLQLQKAVVAKPVNLKQPDTGREAVQDQKFLEQMRAKRARGERPTEEEIARMRRMMGKR
jgi:hypothetical protein